MHNYLRLGQIAFVFSLGLLLPFQAGAQTTPEPAPAPAEPVAPAVAAPAESDVDLFAGVTQPGGLTADAAAERAIESAPSMARARAAVAVAEAGARRTWQALFPQLEVSARYTRLSQISQPDFGGALISPEQAAMSQPVIAAVDDPEARALWTNLFDGLSSSEGFSFPVLLNQYALRASVSYPVSDLFFSILPAYRAQESAVEAQQAQIDVEARQVALRARETFFEVARARASAFVAQQAVVQVQANRARVNTLVEGGVVPRVDLLRVDALAAQAQVGVAQANAGVAVTEQALRVLLHMPREEPLIIGQNLQQAPPAITQSIEELTERALEDRVEIAALRRAINARKGAIRAELGRRYPQLLVQANVDYANPNQRIIPSRQEFDATWDVSVILRWSPNEFGAARSRVTEARAMLVQMETDIDAIRDGVRMEIAQSAAQFEASRAVVAAAEAGIEAAEEQRRVRVAQLNAGTVVASDLTDAETDLTRARLSLVNATIDLHLQHARLRRAAALD